MQFIPGSVIFTHRTGIVPRMIVAGQKIRFTGERAEHAHWSHVGLIVSEDGALVEALGHGVERTSVWKYRDIEHKIWVPRTCYDDPLARARVVRFAEHAVGRRYNYTEIASLGIYLATNTHLRLVMDNQMICSGLVAESLSRTDLIFPREPMFMMPADLSEAAAADTTSLSA